MADGEAAAPETPKGGKKTMLLVAVLLIAEAAVLGGAFMFLGGEPEVSTADMTQLDPVAAELEQPVEIKVLEDRLPNNTRGRTFVYDTEIWISVRKKHEEQTLSEVERYRQSILADVIAIWRTSDPRHFNEARDETLTRKVEALFNDRLGADPETGEPILLRAIIVNRGGFPIDA